jgi:hypothetical protein
MTQGGGFTSGEDFVAARVSIDVPTEGIQSLREMSQAVNNFRTAVEASARSSASFVGYINQIVQAGQQASQMQQQLAASLERTADLQQRMQTGMPGMSSSAALPMSRSAPQGYVDPWAGMGVGMGGQRTPPPGDIQSQIIDPTRQLDPQKYINAQAGRYRVMPGELSTPTGAPNWQEHANRIDQRDKQTREQEDKTPGSSGMGASDLQGQVGKFGGLASNIMNEMGPGGSHMSTLGMLGRSMRSLGSRPVSAAAPGGSGPEAAEAASEGGSAAGDAMGGFMGGAFGGLGKLGGLLKGLGPAGMGIGAGLAGLGAIEKGGSIYQNYKNLGMIRGGGAGQGFDTEMAVRGMALNPFLTTEQSRQIIMAGLTEGFSGKQFDNVTDFMASNLKNMNISVSDSVQMLRKNVEQGGQSIQGLGASLATLKVLSQSGASSFPDLLQNFQATSGALIGQGVSGGAAAQQAILSGQLFSNDQVLKGVGGQMLSGMSPMAMGMMHAWGGANVPAGLMPNEIGPYMAANGQNETGAMMNVVKHLVNSMFKNPATRQKGSAAYFNQLGVLTNLMQKYFPGANLNQAQVQDMVDQIIGGNDPVADAQKRVNDVNQQVTSPGIMERAGALAGGFGHALFDAGKVVVDAAHGDFAGAGRAADDQQKVWSQGAYTATAGAENPILNNIVGQYGPGDILVVDKNGNAKPLTGAKDQVQGLARGDLTWKRKGDQGNGISLAQTPLSMDPSFRTGGGGSTNVSFSPATVNVNVNTTTGQATASPNVIQLTPNQQAVNSGVGSNTMNNPPPGDGYGYRYGGTEAR